jgi:DNA-directed RNA polymerase subunit A'
VANWNIEDCKKFILSENYPKALYVIRSDGKRVRVTEQSKQEIADTLAAGFMVERQLMDGDTVLFNRQPSLHRISIMCHNVKVLPGRTFRLNQIVCPPYNADFDGDEMNLHVLQSEESQVEAEMLMKVHDQIISPRHGHAIIKPQEDHVSGIFFMTRRESEFTRQEACDILAIAGITKLPEPDRGKKFSGKLLFSLMLPKELNLSLKSKLCRKCATCKKENCEYDAYIHIKDGVLLTGAIESKAFENEILEKIVHLQGTEAGRRFLDDGTRMALKVISGQGLSVSLANYSVDPETVKKLAELEDTMKREVDSAVLQYRNKTLQRSPGRSFRETLEEKVMEITSRARDKSGSMIERSLGMDNTSIIMAKIGARGSLLNATQMAAMLGQQAVRGKRVTRGYRGRTLPHFKKRDLGALARGCVTNSFRTGLSAPEFFHHSMGGRESLVNTAIRTARSGYMQRRLINALQDIVVMNDFTVRDAGGNLVQFKYGGDGVDPMKSGMKSFVDEGPKKEETDSV